MAAARRVCALTARGDVEGLGCRGDIVMVMAVVIIKMGFLFLHISSLLCR